MAIFTTNFLTGFEHGFIGAAATAGGGLFDTVTAGCTASTSSPRNGSYCLRVVAPANTAARVVKAVTLSGANHLVRFGVKVSARPSSGTVELASVNNAVPADAFALMISSTGQLSLSVATGTPVAGPTIDTTSWHLIDVQIAAGVPRADWKVDGVLQTRANAVASLAGMTTLTLGTRRTSQPAFTADYDDVIVGGYTVAATDWYGDGKVLAQPAGVDGTHATITSLSPGDAGTAYAGTPTNVNTMVDDPPGTLGWTATRSTTDNIALRTATVGAYAEIKPAVTAETGEADAVRAVMSYSSPATTANLAACDVRNSAGVVTALNGTTGGTGAGFNVTANNFKAGMVTKPAAGWTAAEVNAIRFRFGGCTSADINPVPTVQAMMLEVDWPVSVPIVYNDSGSGTVTASGTATESVAYDDTQTTTAVASGSGVETYEPPGTNYTDTQTGLVTATGTVQETAANADTQAGTLTATGTGVEVYQPPAVYTDTRTGTIAASGAALESAAAVDATSGTIAAAGTALETVASADTRAGTVTAAGTGVDSWTLGYGDTATGQLTATGTSLEATAYGDAITGTLTATGTGSETYQPPAGETTYTDATTGTLTVSGTATENAASADLATGAATAAGTGTDAHTRTTAAVGELAATGTALENTAANDARTATVTATGSATELYQPPTVHTDAAVGVVTATGTATDSATATEVATGTLAAAGTALETTTAADTQTGTLALTGTKTENATFADAAAGTTTLTGTSTDIWHPAGPQHIDAATGQLTATGDALELRTYEDTQTAGPTLDGTSQHSATYLDACPGTIRTHGTSTLTTTRNRNRQGHHTTGEPIPPYPAWPTPGTNRRPRRGAHPVGAAGRQRTPA